jgi:DNA-binding transcriptional regulator YiaG
MRCSEPGGMALLGICHRTIHIIQRPQNKVFRIRKPLQADSESFAERLRATRIRYGVTQTKMAGKFRVSLSTVKFWEQGRTQPNPAVRAQVDAFLNGARLANAESAQRGP